MSKKPKRSRHRVPPLPVRSDPVDAHYQAEVDATVARAMRHHRKQELSRTLGHMILDDESQDGQHRLGHWDGVQ